MKITKQDLIELIEEELSALLDEAVPAQTMNVLAKPEFGKPSKFGMPGFSEKPPTGPSSAVSRPTATSAGWQGSEFEGPPEPGTSIISKTGEVEPAGYLAPGVGAKVGGRNVRFVSPSATPKQRRGTPYYSRPLSGRNQGLEEVIQQAVNEILQNLGK